MSYNGSGTFNVNTAGQPVVAGTIITDAAFNALTADLALGLTNAITRDGQSPATANIPMGGYRMTNMSSGVLAQDSATVSQIWNQGNPATIVSAATIDIGAATSTCVEVTGASTITSLGTNYNGPRFVRFAGVNTLTHNATTLNLPGSANIITAANDWAIFEPNVTLNGWNCASFSRGTGMAASGANSDITSLASLTNINGVAVNPVLTGPFTSLETFFTPAQIIDYRNRAFTLDLTTPIQAAVSSSANIWCPPGSALCGPIDFQNTTKKVFVGSGVGLTIFKANATNITLFKKVATSGNIDGATIGRFSIQAHASGSTVSAFKCTGFRDTFFDSVEGLSNGTGAFASLFDVSAAPYVCYKNTWYRPRLNAQANWVKMFDFNNGGTTALGNSNIWSIREPWCVDNTGMTTVIDAVRSAKGVVDAGIFENNTGALAIRQGNAMTITNNWFELNATDISCPTLTDGAANNGFVAWNYFSNAHNVDFFSASFGNVWLANTESGAQTFVNSIGGNNTKIAPGNFTTPAVPTVSYVSGQTGTLALTSGNITRDLNQVTGRVSYNLRYTWSAAASTVSQLGTSVPSGYAIESFSVGVWRGSSGEPAKVSQLTNASFYIANAFADSHNIEIFVTYIKNGY